MACSELPDSTAPYLNQPPKQTMRFCRIGEGFARQLMTKQASQCKVLVIHVLHPAAYAEKPRQTHATQPQVTRGDLEDHTM